MWRRPVVLLGVAVATVCACLWVDVARLDPEKVPLDAREREQAGGSYVKTGLGWTHYEMAGPANGRTVVLVHGFSVPYYLWDGTFEMLRAAGFRVLRYDLYGRGYSERPRAAYDEAMFLRQLEDLLQALRIEGKVDLVGASMGGPLVAAYACGHAQQVRTLTLLGPGYGKGGELPWRLRWPLIGEYVFARDWMPRMPAQQRKDFIHPEQFPDWEDKYRVQMRYPGFRRALLQTLRHYATADWSASYECAGRLRIPALVVWGTRDADSPYAWSAEVMKRMPGARLLTVRDAGHVTHLENPEIVDPVLLEFLRGN